MTNGNSDLQIATKRRILHCLRVLTIGGLKKFVNIKNGTGTETFHKFSFQKIISLYYVPVSTQKHTNDASLLDWKKLCEELVRETAN